MLKLLCAKLFLFAKFKDSSYTNVTSTLFSFVEKKYLSENQ